MDRSEQNKKEDLEKAEKEAAEEEKKALDDPKFVKKSERKKARAKLGQALEQANFNETHPLQD